jgi:hypothetical protein
MEREFIATTLYAWGRGKDKAEAIRNVKAHAGQDVIRRHGYLVYEVTPGTYVNDLGGFNRPAADPEPVLILDKRTAWTKAGAKRNAEAQGGRA